MKIKEWVNRIINHPRNKKFKKFESRSTLSKEGLIIKCFEAFQKFPEINFCFSKNDNRSNMASLDKIDAHKPYSDDNVEVLPLWLNSAKLDSSKEELYKKIIDFCIREPLILNELTTLIKNKLE